MGDDWIPLVLGGITLITPIVFILTKHQQKMTQLLHGAQTQPVNPQHLDTQREIASLRELVAQQTIALDNLAKSQAELKAALTAREEIHQRVGS